MSAIREVTAAEFDEVVRRSPVPVAVDFYSSECAPCEALAPKYEALHELYGQDVRFVKVFRQANRPLAEELGVRSSPTVLFFVQGAEVGHRLGGAIRRSELQRELDALIPAARVAAIAAQVRPFTTYCDVLVLGAGPAGLTTAIYTAQAKQKTVLVDVGLGGGNLAITHQVSNFPGFPQPQPGYQLADQMLQQAKNAGALPRLAAEVTRCNLAEHWVELDGVETVRAKRVVVATGSSPRVIGVEGEREFKGRGISYCATCDAKYYEGKHVVVIGGGNSAAEESLFIAKFASKITMVHQLEALTAHKAVQEQVLQHPKIQVLFRTEPRAFLARNGRTVDGVRLHDLERDTTYVLDTDGVFVFAGMSPNLELFPGVFELDPYGYIRADADMHTNVPGVWAVGDVVSKKFRQMTTAVGDGTIAAMAIAQEAGRDAPAAGPHAY
ncbi:MAG: FAD-dependent oxidoreductase [Deltaproteobacteria bacterium]|nr:FAD-dependent oxidoreductase [Deltaproteobacteria bacterium]